MFSKPYYTFTLIVIVYIAIATLYAINTPKWQTPDEPAHFNYIRYIAETGTLPVLQRGDYDQEYLEKIKAAKFPASMSIDAIRYESYQPPLYYLAATPVYLATRSAGLDATVIALRLFSVALGVVVLIVAYTIVREIFATRNDDLLALATVGAIATIPQHIAVSASISNDLAAEVVLALILLIAIKRINGAIRDSQFVILGGIAFGAALLTKTTAYVPGALVLMGAIFLAKQLRIMNALRDLRITFFLFALAALIAAPMFARNLLIYGITDPLGIARHDAVVIGQPTTAEMIARFGLSKIVSDFFIVTFKSFWAQFGWMGVLVHERIYLALLILSGVAVVGIVKLEVGRWKLEIGSGSRAFTRLLVWINNPLKRRIQHPTSNIQYLALTLCALLLIAAVADYILYNFKFLQFQGRYLFPALIPIALFAILGLRELIPNLFRKIIFALLYIALVALDVICLFWFIVPQLKA